MYHQAQPPHQQQTHQFPQPHTTKKSIYHSLIIGRTLVSPAHTEATSLLHTNILPGTVSHIKIPIAYILEINLVSFMLLQM